MQIVNAMLYAYKNDVNGVRITQSSDSRKSEYDRFDGSPLQYAFNSDYPAIEFDELSPIENGNITKNIQLVVFRDTKYVHKFMCQTSYQEHFEKEISRYMQLKGCDGVICLEVVVKRNGVIQGY